MATAPLPTSPTSALAHEVELKLHVEPEDLARLAALPALAARADGGPAAHRLRTVYFDTPDLRLFGRGIALRLRHDGRGRIQGLKTVSTCAATDAAAVAVRREWEWPVEGDTPDLARLDAEGAGALVPQDTRGALGPIFTTDFRRTAWLVSPDAQTTIEIAIDDGAVESGSSRERISEVELELKSGHIGHLFALAGELHRIVPLRIGIESKAEQGYRLVSGRLPMPVTPDALSLSPLSTAAEAFRHVVRHGLRQLLANEPCALAGGDPEGLHQIRVALRRLRTALALFDALIASPRVKPLRRELRRLSDRLRPARTWDVLAAAVLPPDLAAAVAEGRRVPAARAVAALRDRRCTALILELGAWLERGLWHADADEATRALLDRPMVELAGPCLAARHAKARKTEPDDAERLRRRLRKLRYAVEFFRGLYPPDATRTYCAALGSLLDTLDAAHDAAANARLLSRLDRDAARSMEREARRHSKALPDRYRAFRDTPPFWA